MLNFNKRGNLFKKAESKPLLILFFSISFILIVLALSGKNNNLITGNVVLGPNNPGTVVDDASIGTAVWANGSLNNAKISDNSWAFCGTSSGGTCHYLKTTNFGFNVPGNSIVNGVVVEVKKKANLDTPASHIVDNSIKSKEDTNKIILWVIAAALIISIIYSGYMFYNYSKAQAEGFYPGSYQWQWQKAMSWARESTSENAVFGHWWDYGYWVQSIGERATVLDGGNAIVYWNHLMGRHVLTTPNDSTALEFLYTHNATHLLIDSTDIGKYSAFSSIGADEDYDRFSYISTFFMDPRSTKETNNGKIYAYTGGSGLDEDIIWEDNGTKYTFMQENSGIGAIVIEQNISGALLQPKAIFVQQGRQVNVPIRYSYYDGKLHDFGSGIDAGVFIMPTLESTSGGLQKMQYGYFI